MLTTGKQMLIFVRYIFQEDVHEDMLCALLLSINTTAEEPSKPLNDYIPGKWNWLFCVSVCIDRPDAMSRWLSGVTAWVEGEASECESMHCHP